MSQRRQPWTRGRRVRVWSDLRRCSGGFAYRQLDLRSQFPTCFSDPRNFSALSTTSSADTLLQGCSFRGDWRPRCRILESRWSAHVRLRRTGFRQHVDYPRSSARKESQLLVGWLVALTPQLIPSPLPLGQGRLPFWALRYPNPTPQRTPPSSDRS